MNEDTEELTQVFRALKMSAFKGCANKCPKCERTGHFGSIISYTCDSGNEYLICGWCANIELKEKTELKED